MIHIPFQLLFLLLCICCDVLNVLILMFQASAELPSYLLLLYSSLALTTLDFGFASPGCGFGTPGFQYTFFGTIILSVAVSGAIFGGLLLIGVVRRFVIGQAGVSKWSWYRDRLIRATTILLTFLYVNLTTISIQSLYCVQVNGVWYLQTDMSVKCFTSDHYPMAIVGGFLLLTVTIGFPAVSAFIVVRHRRNLFSEHLLGKFGFLYESFVERNIITRLFSFFGLILSLFLAVAFAAFAAYPTVQFGISLPSTLIYLLLLVFLRPCVQKSEWVMTITTTMISFFAAILNYLSTQNVNPNVTKGMSAVILGMNRVYCGILLLLLLLPLLL